MRMLTGLVISLTMLVLVVEARYGFACFRDDPTLA